MTFPVYLPLGPLRLHPHRVFEFLAYVLGFRLFLAQRRWFGDSLSEGTRISVVAGAAVGAALGCRLLYALQVPSVLAASWRDPLFWLGGKTIVGGLLGGLIGVEVTKAFLGETRSSGDLFVLPLCLAIAVGRVGCFLTGLEDNTSGSPTHLPWGVDFGDGVSRHPAPLYEILALTAIGFWAWRQRGLLERRGDLFRGFMVLYLGFRLAADFLKPGPREYAGLSGIQVACLLGLAYYARDIPRIFGWRGAHHGGPSQALPLL